MFPWMQQLKDEDELDPQGERVYVNCYDVKQFVNRYGLDACVGCSQPYTNRGGGMLCERCQKLIKPEDLQ